MADYTGAVWVINQQIDKSAKELDELVAAGKRIDDNQRVNRQMQIQKSDELADFIAARDLLMNPPAEPVEEPAAEPDPESELTA